MECCNTRLYYGSCKLTIVPMPDCYPEDAPREYKDQVNHKLTTKRIFSCPICNKEVTSHMQYSWKRN